MLITSVIILHGSGYTIVLELEHHPAFIIIVFIFHIFPLAVLPLTVN